MRSVLLLSALTAITVAAPVITPANVIAAVVSDKLVKRDGDCSVQLGTGPLVIPDTIDAFLAYPAFLNTSTLALTPLGYTNAFTNLNAATQGTGYLGVKYLNSYDTIACQQYCDSLEGCQGFNVYYERSPSLDSNNVTCPNPTSVTNIKYTGWGVPLSVYSATNTGQMRDQFQVVITGSNGYNKNAPPPSVRGYLGPTALPGAINAPLDPVTGADTYMGYKFFAFGNGTDQVPSFDPSVCTAACTAQTTYNLGHRIWRWARYLARVLHFTGRRTDDKMTCNQVVAYVLSDENVPQGMYCAMYSEVWGSEYAVNVGQWKGSDWLSVGQAYSYTLRGAPSAGKTP